MIARELSGQRRYEETDSTLGVRSILDSSSQKKSHSRAYVELWTARLCLLQSDGEGALRAVRRAADIYERGTWHRSPRRSRSSARWRGSNRTSPPPSNRSSAGSTLPARAPLPISWSRLSREGPAPPPRAPA